MSTIKDKYSKIRPSKFSADDIHKLSVFISSPNPSKSYSLRNEALSVNTDNLFIIEAPSNPIQSSWQIERNLNSSLGYLLNGSDIFDRQIKKNIDALVRSFLSKHSELLLKAYKTKTNFDDLHYSIVLKEDNIVSRNKIFNFFDEYDELSLSEELSKFNLLEKHPVYFQFVPEHLIHKINLAEQIIPEVK